MPVEPITVYFAVGIPVAILFFAALFWLLRKIPLAKKALAVSIATTVLSGAFLFLDLIVGLGQMIAFYIGILIAAVVGMILRRVLNAWE